MIKKAINNYIYKKNEDKVYNLMNGLTSGGSCYEVIDTKGGFVYKPKDVDVKGSIVTDFVPYVVEMMYKEKNGSDLRSDIRDVADICGSQVEYAEAGDLKDIEMYKD